MSSTSRYSTAYEATSEYLQRYTGANGNNDEWFHNLKNAVLAIGAYRITRPDFNPPDENNNSAAGITRWEAYEKKSQQFLSVVNRACGIELREHLIGDETDPRVIWANIEQFRNSTRESNPVVIRQRLYTERMGSGTAQQFLNKVMSLRRDIISCGGQVTDVEVIAVLLAGLPHANSTDDFHNLVSRIKQSLIDNPANTNLDSVIQAILTRDSEIQTLREVNGEASHSAAAMINRTSRNQRRNPVSNSYRNQRVPPRSSWASTQQESGNCWFCDRPGHYKDKCDDFYEYLIRNLQTHCRYRSDNSESPAHGQARNNELTIDRDEEEVFLDAIEQQLDIDEPAFPAVLNTMAKEEDHHNQGW